MVIASTPYKVAYFFGRGNKWLVFAAVAIVAFLATYLIAYWSWLQEAREVLLAGFLIAALAVSALLVCLRAVGMVLLVITVGRALLQPVPPSSPAPDHAGPAR
jgi:phosphoglycerol transferase MdoB-like AlkP superfamily enzyme